MKLEELREKLRKLEALFADNSATEGEKLAASTAREKLLKKLEDAKLSAKSTEWTFYLKDMWQRKLFIALCGRYNLKTYRYNRQKYTTVLIKAPEAFVNKILWPEFQEMSKVLTEYLEETTSKIIKEEIFESKGEVEIVSEQYQLEACS